jgi:acyl-CoA synthetase (AMP-forming)/AMP-acid ligase II
MATSNNPQQQLSLVHGPTNAPLWHKTIGAVLDGQVQKYGDRTAVVVPWQNIRISFRDLQIRSEAVARALLATGVQHGDKVAIMAGNRIEYIEVFLAAARIGCPLVVLNNTYTPSELVTALERTCKFL